MSKSHLTQVDINDSEPSHNDEHNIADKPAKTSNIHNRVKNIFSSFNSEDILLLLVLLLLIQEEIDDNFLIIAIILLILTE